MDDSDYDTWDEPSARRPKSTRFFGSAGFAGEERPSIRRSNSDPDLQQKPRKPSARRRGSVGMTSEAPKRRGSLGISLNFGPKRPSALKSSSSRRGSFFGNKKSGKKKQEKDDVANQVMAALCGED
jgi:hypothetical protein